MKCINCNREINDSNKFCNYCGTMQPLDREAYEREHPELATAMNNENQNIFPSQQVPHNAATFPTQQSELPTTDVAPNGETNPAIANSHDAYTVQQIPDGDNSADANLMQCPECGRMIPTNSLFCPYCRCPFVAPGQQLQQDGFAPINSPVKHPQVPKDKNYNSHTPQKPKSTGMSGWAKALLTLSMLMLLGAIGGGVYYFFFYNKVTKLRPDEEVVTFSRKGGEKTVTITTDAKEISVAKKPQWVDVTTGDKEITIKCQPLDTYEDREGIIKLKAGDKETKITIKQSANATYLRLSQDLIKTSHNGEEVAIDLDTDGDPSTIDFEIDDHYMCSISEKSNAGFTVIIEENISSSPHECTITISSGNQHKTLTIIQAGKCFYCDGTGKDFCFYCSGNGRNDCSNCGGTGIVYDFLGDPGQCGLCDGHGYFTCENCNGRGYNTCEYCNGTGNNFSTL